MRSYYVTILYYPVAYLEFMLITRIPFVLSTYFTIWLYSRFIKNHQYTQYIISGLLVWGSLLALVVTFQKHHLRLLEEIATTSWQDIYWNQITNYLTFFVLITMGKYFKDTIIQQYNENEKKRLQNIEEINNLKAQISPHFLFNTMNNFYGLAVDQSPKLPGLMIQLSELLRYSLYETNNLLVPLKDELSYLKNYIELEKIRLEDNLRFSYINNVKDDCELPIAPLLLIVFVENAFKHAKRVNTESLYIGINIDIKEKSILVFHIENNCVEEEQKVNNKKQGIGLENARKRLNVIYPANNHFLKTEKTKGRFTVKLEIDLSSKT